MSEASSFFALGGTSLVAVRLMAKLQRLLQPARRLLPDELLRHPELGELIEHLRPDCPVAAPGAPEPAAPPTAASTSTSPPLAPALVLLRAGHAACLAPPLVLVHPAGGHVFHYLHVAHALPGPPRPIYGLKAPGLDEGTAPLETIEALAAHHLAALTAAGLAAAPLALAGSSLGGCVALEMAARLAAAGRPPTPLVMIDTPAPAELPRFADHVAYVEYLFGDMWNVALSRDELARLPEEARLPYALSRLASSGAALGFERDSAQRILAVFVASERAMRAYQPPRYPHPAVYFRARARRRWDPLEPERGWRAALPALALEVVEGDHLSMHEPPHAAALAARLAAHLPDGAPAEPLPGRSASALAGPRAGEPPSSRVS